MFGTKKIFAKILSNKLVVRVGGGFMGIDEFINTYGESEMTKIQRFSSEKIAELHTPTAQLLQQQNTLRMRDGSPKQKVGSTDGRLSA